MNSSWSKMPKYIFEVRNTKIITYKNMYSMSFQNKCELSDAVLTIKLENTDGCVIVSERFAVSNALFSPEKSFLDCVQEVFSICSSDIQDRMSPYDDDSTKCSQLFVTMQNLLWCRKMVYEECVKKWDCDHGMLVKATCDMGGKMSVGSMILFMAKDCFGTLLPSMSQKSIGTLGWEAASREIEEKYAMIVTNTNLMHAEVNHNGLKFTVEAVIIDNDEHLKNMCKENSDSQVTELNSVLYKQLVNRKIEGINAEGYFSMSNFKKRQVLWNRHIQLCNDMLLNNHMVRFMIRTPLCTSCISQNQEKMCVSMLVI